ncbi:MAG TPA: cupin domain-containing protein, partial [Steroidobacteraceae bacterium]|nr:cupin domain-containing protein [Steroidobacteraceae bacterium]
MDPITDIFRTMHVTAFGQHRLEATAPWGVITEKQTEEEVTPSGKKVSRIDLAHFAMISRGNCWLNVEGIPEPIPLTGGDCILLAREISIVLRDSPRTRPRWSFREIAAKANSNVAHYGGGGAPTTIVCGSFSFDRASLKPITQLLPSFILIKADQARTLARHNTMQVLASEMAEQAPGSDVVANRLAEVLFIQVLRAHIASGPERSKGWLRAIFDP